MANKNSRKNDFLYENRDTSSPKIYAVMMKLVNEDREDLAKEVNKVDYLLQYTSTCIKDKDFRQARDTIKIADEHIQKLKEEGVDVEYLIYLYDGIKKKIK